MKSKDTVALWLLVLFVLVPSGNMFYSFTDELKLGDSAITILGYLALTLGVAASGLFLLIHFVSQANELKHYEAEERWREEERRRELSDE